MILDYDIVIREGIVIDGTGIPGYPIDIAIKNGKIVKIEKKLKGAAQHVIDVAGKAVCPGFIDIHTHCDDGILNDADSQKALNYLFQGVTLVIGGNCGSSTANVVDFSNQISNRSIGVNVGLLIGHGRIRRSVMGCENRHANDGELAEMKKQVAAEMEAGAFGISTGLIYIPGAYANINEIVELCKIAQMYGGFYATHLRDEGEKIFDSMAEAYEVSKNSGIPLNLSHHKLIGPHMWGKSGETLAKLKDYKSKGCDISIDQYPYDATSTKINAFLPPWSLEKGPEHLQRLLDNPESRSQILTVVNWNMKNGRGGGDPERVVICNSKNKPELEGKSLAQLTVESGCSPTCENASELVLNLCTFSDIYCVFHCLDEKDVGEIIKFEDGIVASDSKVPKFGEQNPHPRYYGTFPRVLSRYVRDKKIIPIETAIRKMTLNPANRLGLKNRGILKEGACGDIVVFDPDSIQDMATFEQPHQYAKGVEYLLINGKLVVDKGVFTGKMAGKFIKKT